MPKIEWTKLRDDARLWVFGASRPLSEDEAAILLDQVDLLLAQWVAHGDPIFGARQLLDNTILLVGANPGAVPGGCSIDKLFRALKGLEGEFGVSFVDSSLLFYRDGEEIRPVDRSEFRRLAEKGAVTPETVVFDTLVESVADIRGGRWEKPAGSSWHAQIARFH